MYCYVTFTLHVLIKTWRYLTIHDNQVFGFLFHVCPQYQKNTKANMQSKTQALSFRHRVLKCFIRDVNKTSKN
jgi:hypothetical protein